MLLTIDTEQLTSPWQEDPVGDDTFPHVYGPINASAVVHAEPSTGGGTADGSVRRRGGKAGSVSAARPTSRTATDELATSSAVPQLNVTPAPPWP